MSRSGANSTTRQALLDAAKELVLERYASGVAGSDAMAYLTPAEVSARAGVSRASIYHYWGDTADGGTALDTPKPFDRFLEELADLFWSATLDVEDLDLISASLPDDLTDLILETSAFEFDRLRHGPDSVMFRISTVMVLHGADLSTQFRSSVDLLAHSYDHVLPRIGRRVRPPLSTRDLARSIAMLTAGSVITDMHDPGSVSEEVPWPHGPAVTSTRAWNHFSIAAQAIMLHLTEPTDD